MNWVETILLNTQTDLNFPSYASSTNASWLVERYFPHATEYLNYSPFTATRLQEVKTARQLIDEFKTLKDNWDGYGASAISDLACGHAQRFINMIEGIRGLPIPEISPTPSGTIACEWQTHGVEAYLEIGNTRYSGFIKRNGQDSLLFQGNANFLDERDQQVIAAIRSAISPPPIQSTAITEIHTRLRQYELVAA
jgi:hypothetical protein